MSNISFYPNWSHKVDFLEFFNVSTKLLHHKFSDSLNLKDFLPNTTPVKVTWIVNFF